MAATANCITIRDIVKNISEKLDSGDVDSIGYTTESLGQVFLIKEKCNRLENSVNFCNKDGSKIIFYKISIGGFFEDIDINFENIDSIEFRSCTFNDIVQLYNNKTTCIDFTNCVFNHEFRLFPKKGQEENLQDTDTLGIYGCEFKKRLTISAEYGRYTISDTTATENSSIIIGKAKSISIYNSDFSDLSIQGTRGSKYVEDLLLRGKCNFQNLYITNIITRNIEFNEFVNTGILNIVNAEFARNDKETCFTIKNSYLGQMILSSVDLTSVDKLYITNSNISELSTNAVKWKYEIESSSSRDKIDVYRQLKKILSGADDRVGSIKFNSLELGCQKLLLKEEMNYKDWFLIYFGEISGHGQNWVQATAILAISSLLVFYTYMMAYDIGIDHMSMYISFIDPTKFDFVSKITSKSSNSLLNATCLFTFIIWKMFFFAVSYQIVVSFRKFNRKI